MAFSQEPLRLNTNREDLVQNHIKSFNSLFKTKESPGCLDMILRYLPKYEIDSPYITDRPIWRYWIKSIKVKKPYTNDSAAFDKRLFPAEVHFILLIIINNQFFVFFIYDSSLINYSANKINQ